MSYTHHTSDYRQYCHVGNTAQHCRLRLFQVPDFAGDLEESKSTSEGILWSASNGPVNQELDQSYVSSSGRQLTRNSNQDPTTDSQETKQDDTQSSSHRKLGRSGESASSANTRKLERGDIQIGRTRLEFHNLQISDHRYLEKVFKDPRKKLNLAEEAPVIGIEALKTNVLIWGLFMSTTMKAAVHLGPYD